MCLPQVQQREKLPLEPRVTAEQQTVVRGTQSQHRARLEVEHDNGATPTPFDPNVSNSRPWTKRSRLRGDAVYAQIVCIDTDPHVRRAAHNRGNRGRNNQSRDQPRPGVRRAVPHIHPSDDDHDDPDGDQGDANDQPDEQSVSDRLPTGTAKRRQPARPIATGYRRPPYHHAYPTSAVRIR